MVRLAYTMAGIAKLCQKINMSCLGSKRLIYHLSILMTETNIRKDGLAEETPSMNSHHTVNLKFTANELLFWF